MLRWRKKSSPEKPRQTETDRRSAPANHTILTPGWQIKGRIYGKGRVIIQSAFEGELEIQGALVIESTATVKGFLRAEEMRIGGCLEGRLESSRAVQLDETARVDGQVQTPRLQMASGARLNGDVAMEVRGIPLQGLEHSK